jgi:putative tricarboxylic transport membrane protein
MSTERVEVPAPPAPPPPGGAEADGADAAASGGESPSVVSTRTVEIVVAILLLGFAGLMAFDNWRTGMGWAPDGPKAGYFPFYLSVILACASLYWLAEATLKRHRRASPPMSFVNREQLGRVLRVFVPTVLFCVATQFLGLYVASLLLVAGFMRWVGRIAWWKCLVTSAVFSVAMFVVFDLAFDVIMPKGPLEALFGR